MKNEPLVLLDPLLTATLIGTVIPILVGIVTKLRASSGVKAVTLIVLSAVDAALTTAMTVDGVAVISKQTVFQFTMASAVAIASYYGVWRPTGVAPAVQRTTGDVGLG